MQHNRDADAGTAEDNRDAESLAEEAIRWRAVRGSVPNDGESNRDAELVAQEQKAGRRYLRGDRLVSDEERGRGPTKGIEEHRASRRSAA